MKTTLERSRSEKNEVLFQQLSHRSVGSERAVLIVHRKRMGSSPYFHMCEKRNAAVRWTPEPLRGVREQARLYDWLPCTIPVLTLC